VTNGKVEKKILPFDIYLLASDNNQSRGWLNLFDPYNIYEYHGCLNIHMPFSDTIFSINEPDIIPRFVVNLGQDKLILSNIAKPSFPQALNTLVKLMNTRQDHTIL